MRSVIHHLIVATYLAVSLHSISVDAVAKRDIDTINTALKGNNLSTAQAVSKRVGIEQVKQQVQLGITTSAAKKFYDWLDQSASAAQSSRSVRVERSQAGSNMPGSREKQASMPTSPALPKRISERPDMTPRGQSEQPPALPARGEPVSRKRPLPALPAQGEPVSRKRPLPALPVSGQSVSNKQQPPALPAREESLTNIPKPPAMPEAAQRIEKGATGEPKSIFEEIKAGKRLTHHEKEEAQVVKKKEASSMEEALKKRLEQIKKANVEAPVEETGDWD